jgi:ubiquitin C-terminal hydrolase
MRWGFNRPNLPVNASTAITSCHILYQVMMGPFKPEFNNNIQHDCHELMVFLLDGLHEVLNRICDPLNEIIVNVESISGKMATVWQSAFQLFCGFWF